MWLIGHLDLGALYVESGTLDLLHTSVAYNDAIGGQGGAGLGAAAFPGNDASDFGGGLTNLSGTVSAANTILGGNHAKFLTDLDGLLDSQGYNLIQAPGVSQVSGDETGNIYFQGPGLLALADNGGPTQTLALYLGDGESPPSQALDRGGPLPGAPELITNGSFETPALPPMNTSWATAIPGWQLAFGTAFEIQNGISGPSADGSQHVELDSDSNSGIYQDVATTPGTTYTPSHTIGAFTRP